MATECIGGEVKKEGVRVEQKPDSRSKQRTYVSSSPMQSKQELGGARGREGGDPH